MSQSDEKSLIEAARQGDNEAIAELYQMHVQDVYRYIIARVQDTEIAEDITGDVFVRAIETLPRYERKGVPFLGWLYHIAHGLVIDYYRRSDRQKEQQSLDDIQLMAAGGNAEDSAFKSIQQENLQELIQQLTEDQQQVIVLRFIQGYNLKETAEIIGKKENAVKALQFRAVRALMQLLGVDESKGDKS